MRWLLFQGQGEPEFDKARWLPRSDSTALCSVLCQGIRVLALSLISLESGNDDQSLSTTARDIMPGPANRGFPLLGCHYLRSSGGERPDANQSQSVHQKIWHDSSGAFFRVAMEESKSAIRFFTRAKMKRKCG